MLETGKEDTRVSYLKVREKEIMKCIGSGIYNRREIAEHIGVSVDSVRLSFPRIKAVLNSGQAVQREWTWQELAEFAKEHGL